MSRYIEQHPTATGTVLAIASILWSFSLGIICIKYNISLFGLSKVISLIVVTISTFTALSITLTLLIKKQQRLYEAYRQLSLGFIIALLLVAVILRSMILH